MMKENAYMRMVEQEAIIEVDLGGDTKDHIKHMEVNAQIQGLEP